MQRGIISAPAHVHGNGSLFRTDKGLSINDLRYFLLYWDKVIIPTTNLVHLRVPEEEELLKTGLVERPRVPFSGSFDGGLIAKAQILAQTTIAKELITKDKKTDWVLHQIGNEFIIPDKESIDKQAIRVEILNTLPVPTGDVAIPDILEFKERRGDELAQLHQSIDDLYLEILTSPDPNLKTKSAVANFNKSVNEIDKVATEKWKKIKKFDFSAELNLSGKNVVSGATAGAIFDFFTSLCTLPIGTVVGAMASAIKIKAKYTKCFEPSKEKKVLSYLAKAHKEGILQ